VNNLVINNYQNKYLEISILLIVEDIVCRVKQMGGKQNKGLQSTVQRPRLCEQLTFIIGV